MSSYILIRNNIERAQRAYKLYKLHENYHHALHIYHANKIVYDELNSLLKLEELNESLRTRVFNYIFHLEDWFLQFKLCEKEEKLPEDKFLFNSLNYNIPYPSDFLENLI